MNTTQIAYRVQLLLESGNASAAECAKDAIECAHAAQFNQPWPIPALLTIGDAKTAWTAAAERWTERGASHAFGFERPDGW